MSKKLIKVSYLLQIASLWTNFARWFQRGCIHKVSQMVVDHYYATFNNISAISWRSVLLMEETRIKLY